MDDRERRMQAMEDRVDPQWASVGLLSVASGLFLYWLNAGWGWALAFISGGVLLVVWVTVVSVRAAVASHRTS